MNASQECNASNNDSEIVRFNTHDTWKLFLSVGIFCALEIWALLMGFRVLSYVSAAIPASLGLFLVGRNIESYMFILKGNYVVSEKEPLGPIDRTLSLGAMYVVPPMYAVVGMVLSWAPWVSLLMFLGLMLRIYRVWARRLIPQ